MIPSESAICRNFVPGNTSTCSICLYKFCAEDSTNDKYPPVAKTKKICRDCYTTTNKERTRIHRKAFHQKYVKCDLNNHPPHYVPHMFC